MNQKQIRAAVEAMLFAAADPISADKLAQAVQAKNTAVTETQEWWWTVGGPDLRQLEELLAGIMHASIPIMHAKVEANGEEHVSKLGT